MYKCSGKFLVTVAVGAEALNDGILEVEDGDMEIGHIPLVRRVVYQKGLHYFYK